MDHNKQEDIWGEEWQWPVVGEVTDSMLAQQAEECLLEVKTEEEIRMEKFIVENILESDESHHGNSSGSSSDTFYTYKAPTSNPIYPPTTSFTQSGMISFLPPINNTAWPTSNNSNLVRTSSTPSSFSMRLPTRNSYSMWPININRSPYNSSMVWPIPNQEITNHYSLPVTNSQPIPIFPSVSTTSTMYTPITRSQSNPTSPSLFRTFNPSSLPPPSPSGRLRRNSSRSSEQCGFCKRNGEISDIYLSHRLSDSQGRVVCPQLRVLVCQLCGATGDTAHTWSYCPRNTQAPSVALPTLLKSTPRQSDGKWRRRGGR